MEKDIVAEIRQFERVPEGRHILEQAILAKGAENLTDEDFENLKALAHDKSEFIDKEKMQMMVDFGFARPIDYCQFRNVFRRIYHTDYREGMYGWYPLSPRFYQSTNNILAIFE
ncbi:MAG: hypothetical protein WD876_02570 [Candidatus Pacearchaeota archaeon]